VCPCRTCRNLSPVRDTNPFLRWPAASLGAFGSVSHHSLALDLEGPFPGSTVHIFVYVISL
jgi:hypothetical protein